MNSTSQKFVVIGAGINGLVAANYLLRAGHQVTMLERTGRVGGACVAETAEVDGIQQDYPLGATTLGLMQDFVWQETGLADRLQTVACTHPGLVYFPGIEDATLVYDDSARLKRELFNVWGENGDIEAMQRDEERVVSFMQAGFRAAEPPSLERAREELGEELTSLWITGSAKNLLDHYLTAERTKVMSAMDVNESGPVSITEPYSAFVLPIMSSGSVFGGYYGYVRGGMWQITRELGEINRELGMELVLSCEVDEVDTGAGVVRYEDDNGQQKIEFEHVVFATDPQAAARLSGDDALLSKTGQQRVLGTSGKLNLMFRRPIRWKQGTDQAGSDSAFRYFFAVNTLDEFDAATEAVLNGEDFAPGYYQVYCDGAAQREMGLNEPFDRITVFFKNLALGKSGEELKEVEEEIKSFILGHIENPDDCAWSRLLAPADLKQEFGFPGGNIEHTMLVEGQTYSGRQYAGNSNQRFYQLGDIENASICGSGTYPCGSVAGTPGYMCVGELLRSLN